MKKIILLICLLGIYNIALANDFGFSAMDSDKNETVDINEFTTAKPTLHKAAFEAIDLNSDGKLDFNEWKSFSEAHGKNGEIPAAMQKKIQGQGAMPPKMPNAPQMPKMTNPQVPTPPNLPLVMPPKETTLAK